jgi:hypothetical protein
LSSANATAGPAFEVGGFAGDVVVYQGKQYVARWWMRSQTPSDLYGPWKPVA